MTDGPGACFVIDTSPTPLLGYPHACLYDRIPGITLGEEKHGLLPSAGQDPRLCFNCGSPDHAVASCPEPIDREVVSLSRQLFNFLHPNLPAQENTRFYVAEGWKQQRLEWLGSYEPGVIRGPPLRDALGLQDGDPGNTVEWLRNMVHWGYPPGWVSFRDPRRLVCFRILNDEDVSDITTMEWKTFTIFGGMGDDDEVDLRLFHLTESSVSSPTTSSSTTSVDDASPSRWATYPFTYFSSTALSIYNGTPLGDVVSLPSRVSATFTPERRALWECIVSSGLHTDSIPSNPPWRLHGAFGASAVEGPVNHFTPRPPSIPPPPLPPTPNTPKCSVLSRTSTPSFMYEVVDITDDRSVVDMDVSDDSE